VNCALIELSEDHETYVVVPTVARELANEIVNVTLVTTITRQGSLFLWPVRLPAPDGKVNEWHRTAQEAATMATRQWLRVQANMNSRSYDVFVAAGTIADPEWPDFTFGELLRIAFRDKRVDSADHPLVKRLRGLV
jgi:hypothetical protein